LYTIDIITTQCAGHKHKYIYMCIHICSHGRISPQMNAPNHYPGGPTSSTYNLIHVLSVLYPHIERISVPFASVPKMAPQWSSLWSIASATVWTPGLGFHRAHSRAHSSYMARRSPPTTPDESLCTWYYIRKIHSLYSSFFMATMVV